MISRKIDEQTNLRIFENQNWSHTGKRPRVFVSLVSNPVSLVLHYNASRLAFSHLRVGLARSQTLTYSKPGMDMKISMLE